MIFKKLTVNPYEKQNPLTIVLYCIALYYEALY